MYDEEIDRIKQRRERCCAVALENKINKGVQQ